MRALPLEAGMLAVDLDDALAIPAVPYRDPLAWLPSANDPKGRTGYSGSAVAQRPAIVADLEAAALDCLQRLGRCEASDLSAHYGFSIDDVLAYGVAATRAAKRRLGLVPGRKTRGMA